MGRQDEEHGLADKEMPLLGADESQDGEEAPKGIGGKLLVLILFCCLTLIASMEKVALKKAADSLPNYQVFLNQLVVLLFVIVFYGVVLYKTNRTKEITPEMKAFPKWKFALISICDTTAGVLILIPARQVDGDLMTLLLQGVVPATLFFSVVILKKRFHMMHYAGCVVILGGIVMNTLPNIHKGTGGSPWYLLPLFLSSVPASLSGIAAEIALKDQEMDIYYYQFWVACCQFVLSAILSPLSFVLQSPGASVSDLPNNFYQGLLCWVPGGLPSESGCADGFSSVAIYLGLCIVFNIFVSLVVKHGGAVTMMVALTMAVPLQYLIFAVRTPYFVPTPTPIGWLNILGLVVTVVGLVCYHWAKDPTHADDDNTDEASRGIVNSQLTTMSPSMAPFTPRLISTPGTGRSRTSYVKLRREELGTPSRTPTRSHARGGEPSSLRTMSVGHNKRRRPSF